MFVIFWLFILTPACFALTSNPSYLTPSPPLLIADTVNPTTISGLHITSQAGPCITIRNSSNVRIVNSTIGPCGEGRSPVARCGFAAEECDRALGVLVESSSNVTVDNVYIQSVLGGVYAVASGPNIVIRHTTAHGIANCDTGRGHFVMFRSCDCGGAGCGGMRVEHNVAMNNMSNGDDFLNIVNVHTTSGLVDDLIQVSHNYFRGGGPSQYGGGILGCDGGYSRYVNISSNVLIEPGQIGIGFTCGFDSIVQDNVVYQPERRWTNIALFAYGAGEAVCSGHVVRDNRVYYRRYSRNCNLPQNCTDPPSNCPIEDAMYWWGDCNVTDSNNVKDETLNADYPPPPGAGARPTVTANTSTPASITTSQQDGNNVTTFTQQRNGGDDIDDGAPATQAMRETDDAGVSEGTAVLLAVVASSAAVMFLGGVLVGVCIIRRQRHQQQNPVFADGTSGLTKAPPEAASLHRSPGTSRSRSRGRSRHSSQSRVPSAGGATSQYATVSLGSQTSEYIPLPWSTDGGTSDALSYATLSDGKGEWNAPHGGATAMPTYGNINPTRRGDLQSPPIVYQRGDLQVQ